VAELLRRKLGPRTVSEVALYILLRIARQGEVTIDEEKLAKLLFFAIYTEPGPDGRPVLRENPPRLSPEMEFRIYLHGPYIRAKKLIDSMNKLVKRLLGSSNIKGVIEFEGRALITSLLRENLDTLTEILRAILSEKMTRIYGPRYLNQLDEWVIGRLSTLDTNELTKLSLKTLYLETSGKPIRKAMVINMRLDDYIEILRKLKKIHEDYVAGRLRPDYDIEDIEEVLAED